MNNFYLIDKPIWKSSFDIIRQLRRDLQIKKMWHTGTLDPLASWCLLVATWWYTKLIPYLEKDEKEYEFDVMLDGETDSFDFGEPVRYIDRELFKKKKKEITREKIEGILKENFSWIITQIPPKYSAIKVDGKRAYALAREWKQVKISPREVEIQYIELWEFVYPKCCLRACVSAWTYIRSIAAELWSILGSGWYISRLRRTKIWTLSIDEGGTLENLSSLSVEKVLSGSIFIGGDDHMRKLLNDWRRVKYCNHSLSISQKHIFVKNNEGGITHIVCYDWEFLHPIRKI